MEEVLEAGAALGLPLSAENVFGDPGRTIFEATPFVSVDRTIDSQGRPAAYFGDAVEQHVAEHESNPIITTCALGRRGIEEVEMKMNSASLPIIGGLMSQETCHFLKQNVMSDPKMEEGRAEFKENEGRVVEGKMKKSDEQLNQNKGVRGAPYRVPFHCTLCTYSSSTPSILRRHVVNVHEKGSKTTLVCPQCGQGVNGYKGLQIHVAHSHKNWIKVGKEGVAKGKIEQHAGQHPQVSQEQLQQQHAPFQPMPVQHQEQSPCHLLIEQLPSKQAVNNNIPPLPGKRQTAKRSKSAGAQTRRSTTSRKSHQRHNCHLCTFSSTVRGDLVAHVTKVHGSGYPDPPICSQCGLAAANSNSLRNHITSAHGIRYEERSDIHLKGGEEMQQSIDGKDKIANSEREDFDYPDHGAGRRPNPLDTGKRVQRLKKQYWVRCDAAGDEYTYSYLKGSYYCDVCPFKSASRVSQ